MGRHGSAGTIPKLVPLHSDLMWNDILAIQYDLFLSGLHQMNLSTLFYVF